MCRCLEVVVDGEGEGHVGSCRWTESDEGRALGLNWGTGEAKWPAAVANNISRREDMTERIMLSLRVAMKVFLANTFLANLNDSLYYSIITWTTWQIWMLYRVALRGKPEVSEHKEF